DTASRPMSSLPGSPKRQSANRNPSDSASGDDRSAIEIPAIDNVGIGSVIARQMWKAAEIERVVELGLAGREGLVAAGRYGKDIAQADRRSNPLLKHQQHVAAGQPVIDNTFGPPCPRSGDPAKRAEGKPAA